MGFELFVCLFVCSLFDCRQILSFLSSSSSFPFIYPTVSSVINWPTPPTIHRGLEWPQFLNCSVFFVCLIVCLFSVGKFSLILLFYSSVSCVIYWPALCLFDCLSVRLSVCLSVCLSVRPSVCLSVCLPVCCC